MSQESPHGNLKGIRGTPLTCPRCGSSGQIPIVYGDPTDDTIREARRGKVAIGGCMILDADTRCPRCGLEWISSLSAAPLDE